MANATVSFLGQTNSSGDKNALFLKVFAGEVLAAFPKTKQNVTNNNCKIYQSG